MPCAICGLVGDIEIDHIEPFSRGGLDDESNWQPLCFKCNHHKGFIRTNEEVARWVEHNGIRHFIDGLLRAKWRKLYGNLDCPNIDYVIQNKTETYFVAESLWIEFQKRMEAFSAKA